MARSHVLELICVYDSDRTWWTRYCALRGRVVFSKSCSLSVLTTIDERPHPSWQQYLAASPVPITCLAKNAVSNDLHYLVRDNTPSVIARCSHHQLIRLLSSDQIEACNGDLRQFDQQLHAAIERKFLSI